MVQGPNATADGGEEPCSQSTHLLSLFPLLLNQLHLFLSAAVLQAEGEGGARSKDGWALRETPAGRRRGSRSVCKAAQQVEAKAQARPPSEQKMDDNEDQAWRRRRDLTELKEFMWVGREGCLGEFMWGLSAVPRAFSALPPLDSLVFGGLLDEGPERHTTLQFRAGCRKRTLTQTGERLLTCQTQSSASRNSFSAYTSKQNKIMSEAEERKTPQTTTTRQPAVPRWHSLVYASQLVSSLRVFWLRLTLSAQLKALWICRLVW